MISEPTYIFRTNKLGKPYVQSDDPSLTNTLVENDVWLNPTTGTMQTWNGTSWENMQFGGSAIMDDAIANRMIANDISASKITAGILRSQDDDVYINLETGEAKLYNLEMGGQVNGNIIATSSNGLTRVRLRGREGERDITAGIVFEQRETTDTDDWADTGQIYFSYNTRRTCATFNIYEIGAYNGNRPIMGYNAGSDDGLMWRMISTDWLNASYNTFHGTRLMTRETIADSFAERTYVINAIGNCVSGTALVVSGICTCTYKFNDVMQIDFNLKVTTAGSGSSDYGISPTLLRTLNSNIPYLTPVEGGTLQIFNSSGALQTGYVGASFTVASGYWKPSYVSSGSLTAIDESAFTSGMTLIGTCYGRYSFSDEE